jgi:hypothetical protein
VIPGLFVGNGHVVRTKCQQAVPLTHVPLRAADIFIYRQITFFQIKTANVYLLKGANLHGLAFNEFNYFIHTIVVCLCSSYSAPHSPLFFLPN